MHPIYLQKYKENIKYIYTVHIVTIEQKQQRHVASYIYIKKLYIYQSHRSIEKHVLTQLKTKNNKKHV